MSAYDETKQSDVTATPAKPHNPRPSPTSILTVPAPVKALFDRFPLHTYPPNSKPLSCADDDASQNLLHIHATPTAAARGDPALHPGSLKWQTLLRIYSIPFALRASTTHASPNAALPFLLPAATTGSRECLTTSTLPSWIRAQSSAPARAPTNALHEALLRPIRAAYLHAVYLTPAVFAARTKAVHVDPATSAGVVQDVLAWQLQCEAADEITGGSGAVWPRIDAAAVYSEAAEALEALGTVLGDSRWFGRRKEPPEERVSMEDEGVGNWEVPGILDAGVFGYTHVILEMLDGLDRSQETEMARALLDAVREQDNLIQHRDRVLRYYF